MGLDMYLQRSKEMSKEAFAAAYNGDENLGVIYWRKANAIHRYFCDYGSLAKDGQDEVGYYYIDRQDLMNLVRRIQSIISGETKSEEIKYFDIERGREVNETVDYKLNIDVALDLLPTSPGFFFGNTDYGYWYFKDLERTLELIKEELRDNPSQETWFYYASW